MVAICLCFQVHQPKRLRNYSYFDIGNHHHYEDDVANKDIFLKIAQKCYLPTNALLLKLIKQHAGAFKVAFSLTGVFIEQCKKFSPETLDSFRKLVDTGCVELFNETYYHSLSFLFSPQEFKQQVLLHRALIEKEFGYNATTFRNTELIYNNELAQMVESLGYKTIFAEGADQILLKRSPNFVYQPIGCSKLKLLLRNYQLTDDIGFRFSDRAWVEHPVHADKYASWLHALAGRADIVNLFMDFETFGEHQWSDTGIFDFLRNLPNQVLKHKEFAFLTPAEASKSLSCIAKLNAPNFVSWADTDRDLTAWRGNSMQEDALTAIYALEADIKEFGDIKLIRTWRNLLVSDHFYYMCTKYAGDGDVHKYFSPYRGPYDAYINYQNVVADLTLELAKRREQSVKITVSTKRNSGRKCVVTDSWWAKIRRFLSFNRYG